MSSGTPFEKLADSMRTNAVARGYMGTEHATAEQLVERFAEFGNACVYCGRSDLTLSPDHDIPITRGGSNAITNILPSCLPCNIRKKARTSDEYRALLAGHPRVLHRSPWNQAAVLKSIKTNTMNPFLVSTLVQAGWTPPPDMTVESPRRRTMTTSEVAKILAMSRASVLRLINCGDLRAFNLAVPGASRKTIRIRDDDLQTFIAERTRGPAPVSA